MYAVKTHGTESARNLALNDTMINTQDWRKSWLSPRFIYTCGAASCFALLGFGFFLEYARGLTPCLLCIIQRVCFLGCGSLFLWGALVQGGRGKGRIFIPTLGVGFSAMGMLVATRQLWLQYSPIASEGTCGPDIGYLSKTLPFSEILIRALQGDGQCNEILWSFLGISIPGWSLIFLTLLCVASVYLLHQSLVRS